MPEAGGVHLSLAPPPPLDFTGNEPALAGLPPPLPLMDLEGGLLLPPNIHVPDASSRVSRGSCSGTEDGLPLALIPPSHLPVQPNVGPGRPPSNLDQGDLLPGLGLPAIPGLPPPPPVQMPLPPLPPLPEDLAHPSKRPRLDAEVA